MSSVVEYYPGYSQRQVQENLRWQSIASISNANPMIVTTSNDHGYVVGMLVTFQIPSQFGMVNLNGTVAQITDITSDTLTVSLDSTNYPIFSYPSPLPSAYTPPTVIPIASGPYRPPFPLPYGNQDSFEGVIYNDGAVP